MRILKRYFFINCFKLGLFFTILIIGRIKVQKYINNKNKKIIEEFNNIDPIFPTDEKGFQFGKFKPGIDGYFELPEVPFGKMHLTL